MCERLMALRLGIFSKFEEFPFPIPLILIFIIIINEIIEIEFTLSIT